MTYDAKSDNYIPDFPAVPSSGYRVVNLAQALPSQRGSVPDNVIHCDDLLQAQAILFPEIL